MSAWISPIFCQLHMCLLISAMLSVSLMKLFLHSHSFFRLETFDKSLQFDLSWFARLHRSVCQQNDTNILIMCSCRHLNVKNEKPLQFSTFSTRNRGSRTPFCHWSTKFLQRFLFVPHWHLNHGYKLVAPSHMSSSFPSFLWPYLKTECQNKNLPFSELQLNSKFLIENQSNKLILNLPDLQQYTMKITQQSKWVTAFF